VSEEDIRRYTLAELRKMVEAGETHTDWERLRNMTEEELERSIADDPDWCDLIVDWENATWMSPEKEAVMLSLDREVIDWFRQQGGDFRDRITEMLREHVRARRKDAA